MLTRATTTPHGVHLLGDISSVVRDKLVPYQNGCTFRVGVPLEKADTVILRSQPLEVDQYPNLKLIIRSGTEPPPEVRGKRIDEGKAYVQMTLGANSESVAQKVVGAVTIIIGKMHESAAYVRSMDLSKPQSELTKTMEKDKAAFLGREFGSITLGVIGTGQIGSRVVQLANLLGMRVIVFEKDRLSVAFRLLPSNVMKAATIDEVFQKADVVSIHVPGEGNSALVGPRLIGMMKKGAGLINFARRDVCDNEAVYASLQKKDGIGGYVIDFVDTTLLPHPRLVSLTHLGGNTAEAQVRCADMAAEQAIDFWRRGNMWPSKNMPTNVLDQAASAVMRLAVPHSNIVGVLDKVQHVIKTANVSISTSHNNTKGAVGYYLVDLDQPLPADKIEQIRRMSEVIDVMTFEF